MHLLCCDWGTSSFRLRLIDRNSRKLLGEERSKGGIGNTFLRWEKDCEHKGVSKTEFFRQELKNAVNSLSTKLSLNLLNTPIVISGMASSSIGLKELPYSPVPFLLDGSEAQVDYLEAEQSFPNDLFLVSGVRSEQDVMRGEETQLVGLREVLNHMDFFSNKTIFIFPGTHCKHIYVQNNRIVEFKTFITGEIFNLLSHHSLLKNAIERPQNFSLEDSGNLRGFVKGLGASDSTNILNSLFTVRTNELFSILEKKHNFFYLSGLLIGSELRSIVQDRSLKVVVCSGSNLFYFYKKALEELKLFDKMDFVEPDIIDRATIAGQVVMYNKNKK